jgi:hypothetical protein
MTPARAAFPLYWPQAAAGYFAALVALAAFAAFAALAALTARPLPAQAATTHAAAAKDVARTYQPLLPPRMTHVIHVTIAPEGGNLCSGGRERVVEFTERQRVVQVGRSRPRCRR